MFIQSLSLSTCCLGLFQDENVEKLDSDFSSVCGYSCIGKGWSMAGYPRRYKNEPCKIVLLGVCLGLFSHIIGRHPYEVRYFRCVWQ